MKTIYFAAVETYYDTNDTLHYTSWEFRVSYCDVGPSTVTARRKEWITFARSNTGVVDSNPTRGMDVCVRAVLCIGSGLTTAWSLVQAVVPSVYKDYETEEEARAQQRAVEPLMNEWLWRSFEKDNLFLTEGSDAECLFSWSVIYTLLFMFWFIDVGCKQCCIIARIARCSSPTFAVYIPTVYLLLLSAYGD
jgi:hypothetical protein